MEHADDAASHSQAAEDGTSRDNHSTTNGDAASAGPDVSSDDTETGNIVPTSGEAAGGAAMDLGAIPQGRAVEESGGMETSSGGGDGVAIEINNVDEEDDDDVEVTPATDVSLEKGNSHDKEIVNSLPLIELGGSGRHPSAVNTDDVVTAEESRTRLMDNAICLSRADDESLDDNSKPRGDAASGTMIICNSSKREAARCIYDLCSPPIKDDNPPDGGAGDWRQSVARSSRSGVRYTLTKNC